MIKKILIKFAVIKDPLKLFNFIKQKVSILFEGKYSSYHRHNLGYSSKNGYEQALNDTKTRFLNKTMYDSEFQLDRIFKQNKQLNKIAVDIGSGIGWLSAFLSSKFDKVYSIEPSLEAINISKRINKKIMNIEFINKFAEDALNNDLKLDSPTLFVTGRVLSHLPDRIVSKILKSIENIAPKGSVICLNEVYGKPTKSKTWHVRSSDWWMTKLSTEFWDCKFLKESSLGNNTWIGIHAIRK